MHNLSRLTVYSVDNNKQVADSIAAVLLDMGHTCIACYSAVEVLRLIRDITPNCVIFDIAMPGMDGLVLAHELRNQFDDDIVLVAITGISSDDPKVQEVFSVVDHYFEKPVTTEMLAKIFSLTLSQ